RSRSVFGSPCRQGSRIRGTAPPRRRLPLGQRGRGAHPNHPERPRLAVVLGDADIFAFLEGMPVELEDRLVVGVAGLVGEGPAAARRVHQLAVLVVLAVPEAMDDAGLAEL